MRPLATLLFAALFAPAPVFAQSDPSGLSRNATLFEEKWGGIEASFAAKVKARNDVYLQALTAREKAFQAEGDLEGVLACREEVARLKEGVGPSGPAEVTVISALDFKDGQKIREYGVCIILGPPVGSEASLVHRFAGGFYRLRLKAGQQKAGDEDVKAEIRVGDDFAAPFTVSALHTSPVEHVIDCSLPPGEHRVVIEFKNDYYKPALPDATAQDRNLHLFSLAIEGPIGRAPAAGGKIGELRQAWASDLERLENAQKNEESELARKYVEALVGLRTNLNRTNRQAEGELVQAEIERVVRLVPGLVAPATAPAAESSRPPAGRLLLQYSFDNAEGGSAKPDGAAGPAFRAHGGASFLSVPNCGRVLKLSGSSDYLELREPAGMNLDDKSFSIILLSSDLSAEHSAMLFKGREEEPEAAMVVGHHAGKLVFRLGEAVVTCEPKGDQEAWKQMAFVFNAAARDIKIYLDGKEAASGSAPAALKGTDGAPFLIGRHPHREGVAYAGKIDNLRVTDRAMAPHEIASLYTRDKVEIDKLLRSWLGPPPRNPRELEAFLVGTLWSLRTERSPDGPGRIYYVTFRSGGRMEIIDHWEHYRFKATSARNIEVYREYAGTVHKIEFANGFDRLSGEYFGEGARDYGTKRRGCFLEREKR